MKINISERIFHFRQPAGTSRGVYTERKSWIIELADGERTGIGECAPLPGLSCDDIPEYEKTLRALCDKFEQEGQIDYNLMRPYPSMHGGMHGCREWISIAREMGIGSWITSALESNIGLNAIAQFTADVYGDNITMAQGLGTGQLFTDNIDMPLEIRDNALWISKNS